MCVFLCTQMGYDRLKWQASCYGEVWIPEGVKGLSAALITSLGKVKLHFTLHSKIIYFDRS